MPYQAVLLDVDGTLVDSNAAHAHAWVEALAASGRRVDFLRVRPLVGMGSDKVLPALAGIPADSPEGEQLVKLRGEIFRRDHLPYLRPTRGAQRLLEWLRDDGLQLVVATSARPEELEGLLEVAGATRLVDAGLAQDIYLTTTSREGGEPATPWYSGPVPPALEVVTRKRWSDDGAEIVFEHARIGHRAPSLFKSAPSSV